MQEQEWKKGKGVRRGQWKKASIEKYKIKI